MSFKKKILGSAKHEKNYLCQTYGNDFCVALEEWCNKIVELAPHQPRTLHLIPLEDVLDTEHKPWSYVWQKIRDKTALDRLRSLVSFIQSRKPPYELIAAQVRIHAQGAYWVNVIAVVEVDRVEEDVIFTYLTWFGDEV